MRRPYADQIRHQRGVLGRVHRVYGSAKGMANEVDFRHNGCCQIIIMPKIVDRFFKIVIFIKG